MRTPPPGSKTYPSYIDFQEELFRWKNTERTIIFTNGCFDILHQGHIDYLFGCAQLADRLIIGLNADESVKKLKGDQRPINNEESRSKILASIAFVDAVVIFNDETPISLIKSIKPDVIAKGGDYELGKMDGVKFVKSYGGKVITIPFAKGFSTTGIIQRIRKQ